ncbi:MAG: amino acid ABC transporter permease [Pseudomonadota bacterium]
MNYNWNWSIFSAMTPDGEGTYWQTLLSGLGWTLATALSAWIIALAIGTVIGTIRTLPSRSLARAANLYIEAFRNIPLLVQMFVWYFVVPELLPNVVGDWIKSLSQGSFLTAVVCLGLFTSARVAIQTSAGINALSKGQMAAGIALGLTTYQTYRYILLPMAFRVVIPPLTNEFLSVMKNTSVALTIGLLELTARTRAMQEFSFQVFEAFSAATLIYLVMNISVVGLMARLERYVAIPGMATPRVKGK